MSVDKLIEELRTWGAPNKGEAKPLMRRAASALASTQAEILRLKAALAPFAKEAEDWAVYPDAEGLVEGWTDGPTSSLNVGHLRAAARSLSHDGEEGA